MSAVQCSVTMGPAMPGTPQWSRWPRVSGRVPSWCVSTPCRGDKLTLLSCVYMCVLGDRAGTHSREVASAVFPNLLIPPRVGGKIVAMYHPAGC